MLLLSLVASVGVLDGSFISFISCIDGSYVEFVFVAERWVNRGIGKNRDTSIPSMRRFPCKAKVKPLNHNETVSMIASESCIDGIIFLSPSPR